MNTTMRKNYKVPQTEVILVSLELMQSGMGIIRGSGNGESKDYTDSDDIW